MSTIAGSYIPAPKDAKGFEEIVADCARIIWPSHHFAPYGRPGQKQDGVDVIGTVLGFGAIAYQCKNTIGGVSNKVILEEALEAAKHPITISQLFIATTAQRDTSTRVYAMSLYGSNPAVTFPVDVIFWDDIVGILARNLSIFQTHYPQIPLGVQGRSDHDKALLDGIVGLLGRSGAIDFLRDHDMGAGIHGHETDRISDFYHQWNRSDRTFSDQNLEGLRRILHEQCGMYLSYIATNFFRDNGMLSVKYLRESNPPLYESKINTIHQMASSIIQSYDALVIAGR